jgi:hypothetical protein
MSEESDDELARFAYSATITAEFQPYLMALGAMAARWALFEFAINDAIWELANVGRKAGTCITSQLIGPGPRFRCLVALLNLRGTPDDLAKQMNSISGEAEKFGRQRNRYLHDPLVRHRVKNTIHRIETTADRKLRHDFMPVEITDIATLADNIDTLRNDFIELMDSVVEKTPAWPRTEYEQSEGIRPRHSRSKTPPSEPELPLEPLGS